MNWIFRLYLRKFLLIFFYDILVYNSSKTNHLSELEIVLLVLEMKRYSKYVFGASQIECLGYIIIIARVRTGRQKIQVLRGWHIPRALKQLGGF